MNFDNVTRKGLSIHFTLAMVVTALGNIARRDPDRIGKSDGGRCVYGVIENGALVPVCIVGQWFSDLGLLRLLLNNPSEVESWNTEMQGACNVGGHMWEALAAYGITADEDAQKFAHRVQSRQDDGLTWSDAFNGAVADHREAEQDALNERLDRLFG
jgi:hypothetical protein